MDVIVDGIEDLITVDEEDNSFIEDFLSQFNSYAWDNKRIVIAISIDDEEHTTPFPDTVLKMSTSDISKLIINTISVDELCAETLVELQNNISGCRDFFNEVLDEIYSQNYTMVDQKLVSAVGSWKVCQTALVMIVRLNAEKVSEDIVDSISDLFNQLSNSFDAIGNFFLKKDYGSAKDYIEDVVDAIEKVATLVNKVSELIS